MRRRSRRLQGCARPKGGIEPRDSAHAAGELGAPGLPERGVRAAVGQQLVVRAELLEQPVLDDRDAVGVVRGVEAVRDRHDRPPLEHGRERALEVSRGARVEQRRGLVEDEGVRVGEHEPGQRELLRLRRGQRMTARADGRLQALGERDRPLERVDRLERLHELLGRGVGVREPEVVGERADEDVLLLGDERDLLAQRLQRELDEMDAADLDAARPGRVDPGEEAAESRLARAGGPDDRDALARPQVEVDAVQHVPTGDIRVADVACAERVAVRHAARGDAVGRHRLDPDEPGERGAADLDLVEPRDEAVDRVGELLGVEHDRGHLADRRVPRVDEPASPEQPGDHRQHVGDLRGREPERPEPQRVPLCCVGLAEVVVDPADAILVQPEGLDGQAAVDGLADRARERRVRGALAEVALRRPPEVPARPDHDRRDPGDEGERRGRAHPDRGGDGQRRRQGGDQGLGDREADRAGERVDVGGRARDEIARPGALDGREREGEDAAHEVLPQLGEDLLGDHEGGAPGGPGEAGLEDHEPGEDDHDGVDVRLRRPVPDRLDEPAEQHRPDEAGSRGEGMEQDDARERPAVAARERPGVRAQGRAVGDRQQAHSLSPRVTVSR